MTTAQLETTDLSAYAGTWALEPTGPSVGFVTEAMWVLTVGRTMRAVDGTVTVGTDGALSVSVVFDAATTDTKNRKRDAHLKTEDCFEIQKYPTITFAVTAAPPLPTGQVELTGDLTIHGRSRPVTVLADVSATEERATFTAGFDIDRSAWGITWSKTGAGLSDHMTVTAAFTRS